MWAVSPLAWSQSLITVYALHGLLAALMVAVVLVWPNRPLLIGAIRRAGPGASPHVRALAAVILLLVWRVHGRELHASGGAVLAVGLLVAGAFYLRIPLALW